MKYYGIYPAIVIQNNDPEFAGRVKVYVPGITNILYDGWNDEAKDKEVTFVDGDLTPVLKELRSVLPWAQNVSPLFGGGCDTLSNGGKRRAIARPSGTFSIPNVGAHTYVFFVGGDTNSPAFFGANHGASAWQHVMGQQYPNGYENAGGGKYINRHVINSNKHYIELVDDDGEETINIYSIKDADTVIANDTSLSVGNDSSATIGNNNTVSIGNDSTLTIGGNWKVSVVGDASITVSGSVDITSGGEMNLTSGGNMKLTAPRIDLN